jgi:hypothetical protein
MSRERRISNTARQQIEANALRDGGFVEQFQKVETRLAARYGDVFLKVTEPDGSRSHMRVVLSSNHGTATGYEAHQKFDRVAAVAKASRRGKVKVRINGSRNVASKPERAQEVLDRSVGKPERTRLRKRVSLEFGFDEPKMRSRKGWDTVPDGHVDEYILSGD